MQKNRDVEEDVGVRANFELRLFDEDRINYMFILQRCGRMWGGDDGLELGAAVETLDVPNV